MSLESKTPSLDKAYAAFWHAVNNVGKNAVNPHHKNNYANLEAVMAVVKPAMEKQGLVLLQVPGDIKDGNQSLISSLIHAESGERWDFRMEIPLGEKRTAQSTGSGLTYARRYFILTISGMCPVDDDGESASEPEEVEEVVEKSYASPQALISEMEKYAKGKKGKAAADTFTELYKEKASNSGDKPCANKFVELRGAIKNG